MTENPNNPDSTTGVAGLRVKPIFAWYDLWIGAFVDRSKRRLYVFPVPCLGVVIEWGRP